MVKLKTPLAEKLLVVLSLASDEEKGKTKAQAGESVSQCFLPPDCSDSEEDSTKDIISNKSHHKLVRRQKAERLLFLVTTATQYDITNG